jgi:hypothetical protein
VVVWGANIYFSLYFILDLLYKRLRKLMDVRMILFWYINVMLLKKLIH